jgi:hypothetical protein
VAPTPAAAISRPPTAGPTIAPVFVRQHEARHQRPERGRADRPQGGRDRGEHVERPDLRRRREGVRGEEPRHDHQSDLDPEDELPAVEPVGDRATDG